MLVGQQAPGFSTKAYHRGQFINLNLTDFRNKWVVLFFYAGDFTYV